MRTLLTLLLFAQLAPVLPQACTSQLLDIDVDLVDFWNGADRTPNGDLVGSLGLTSNYKDLYALRMDPGGAVIWQHVLSPQDDQKLFFVNIVRATPDNGMLLAGLMLNEPQDWRARFVVKVDAAGQVVWGRVYETDVIPTSIHSFDVAAFADGSVLLGLGGDHGVLAVRLDGAGIPIWQQRYSPYPGEEGFAGRQLCIVTLPDGSFTLATGGLGDDPWIWHMGADGTLLWARHYDDPNPVGIHLAALANGDYLMCTYPTVHRIGADGTYLWGRSYQQMNITTGHELANGDLLLSSIYRTYRTNATGIPYTTSWDLPENISKKYSMGVAGDTLRLATSWFFGTNEPGILIAPLAQELDCTETGYVYSNGIFAPSGWIVPAYTGDQPLTSWPLLFDPVIDLQSLDIAAQLITPGARPGMPMMWYGNVQNYGGEISGPLTVTLTFDPSFSILTTTPLPASSSPGTITWALPATSGAYMDPWSAVQAELLVPLSVQLGDVVTATLSVTQDSTDSAPWNNSVTDSTIAVNSYDPNDKRVVPSEVYDLATDSILVYTIRFQNTGTAEAIDVVVVDTLPPTVDIATFRMGAASHENAWSISPQGVLTVSFLGINLPDSNSNEAASHGAFIFTVHPTQPFLPNTRIDNAVDIYFDQNDPIRTNIATVVAQIVVSVPELRNTGISVFPVPATDAINLTGDANSTIEGMRFIAVDGRQVYASFSTTAPGKWRIPVGHLAPGYHLLLVTWKNSAPVVVPFVRE